MPETRCRYCSKTFTVKPHRVLTAQFCTRSCKAEHSKKNSGATRICPVCQSSFYAKGNPSSRGKYCSRQCGAVGRRKGKEIVCEYCGEPAYKSPAFLLGHRHHFCSLPCQIEWQRRSKTEYTCKVCGEKFKCSPSKERNSGYTIKYCSMVCRNSDPDFRKHYGRMNLIQQQIKGLNKLEYAGQSLLISLGVEFDEQVLLYDKFCVDVVLQDSSIIIQWDGDYWHGNPARFPVLDKRQANRKRLDESQDAYLAKCGHRILRFWEMDVNKNPQLVLQKIQEAINDNQ